MSTPRGTGRDRPGEWVEGGTESLELELDQRVRHDIRRPLHHVYWITCLGNLFDAPVTRFVGLTPFRSNAVISG